MERTLVLPLEIPSINVSSFNAYICYFNHHSTSINNSLKLSSLEEFWWQDADICFSCRQSIWLRNSGRMFLFFFSLETFWRIMTSVWQQKTSGSSTLALIFHFYFWYISPLIHKIFFQLFSFLWDMIVSSESYFLVHGMYWRWLFFQKVRFVFQISKIKIFQITILSLKLEFVVYWYWQEI